MILVGLGLTQTRVPMESRDVSGRATQNISLLELLQSILRKSSRKRI